MSTSATQMLINALPVSVEPGETVLQAALRAGIRFPNSCRVGACGRCRCRLRGGEVLELTESAYLLSAEEIRNGIVLACQSRPRAAVSIEVELDPTAPTQTRSGIVCAQQRLTHDITRLDLQLSEPLDYRAGQFARLELPQLAGLQRCYSFATPATADGSVSFTVRRVEGGRFSSLIHDTDLVGSPIALEGPHGDFWLRPAAAPLLMVGGGSGLAPLLAMLQAALAEGVQREVSLLFGARTQADLYALQDIETLARAWPVAFRFLPVLSAEAADSSWTGARGWVSEHIPALLATGSHAYLCGPPPMIDAAALQLQALGVASADIHCDRFVSAAEAPSPAQAETVPESADPDAGLWHYAKFFGFHAVGLFSAISLLAGGTWTSLGLLAVVAFYIVGDFVSGDDLSTPRYAHPKVLTVQLWLALPLLALIVFCAVWSVSPSDPLGFGAWLGGLAGFDLLAARAATGLGHHLSALILTSLMIGMIGTITAHELTHRTWDTTSLLIGRWLLAFSFDTAFAIEHVYGHHRYVSTAHDPATAPRGRNVYAHIVLSTLRGNASAWRIERERLHKRGLPTMSRHNAVLRGQAMSIALLALAAGVGGWAGALMFVACGLGGKALLEIVNYMEHYGLLRSPQSPVQPRHSWNTNRRVSSWTLFNLTRHSHHHAQGEIAYQNLRPMADAPQMLSGYLTVLVLTLIPPLWQRLMAPKLLAWDRDFANAEERRLAATANARSGLKSLQPGA